MIRSNLEPLSVLALLRRRDLYSRLGPVAPLQFFAAELRPIRKAIDRYFADHKGSDLIPIHQLQILVRREYGTKAQPLAREALKVLGALPTDPPRSVQDELRAFVLQEGVRNLLLDSGKALDRGELSLDGLRMDVEKLWQARESHESGVEYFEAGTDYFEEIDRKRLATGVPGLDNALKGGLGSGELGMVIAPPGGGKTFTLINFGAHALTLGKRVLHVTMEIHTREVLLRYDLRLTGKREEEIRKHRKFITDARKKVSKAGGRLVIQDRSHQELSTHDLEYIIMQDFPKGLDLLIVDYGDLLGSTKQFEGRRFEVGQVYKDLRRIASKYDIPVWTASQATREAARDGYDFDSTDVAEDISKFATVDASVCARQTNEMKEAGRMDFLLDKTRKAETNPKIPMAVSYATWSMSPVVEEPIEQMQRAVIGGEDGQEEKAERQSKRVRVPLHRRQGQKRGQKEMEAGGEAGGNPSRRVGRKGAQRVRKGDQGTDE